MHLVTDKITVPVGAGPDVADITHDLDAAITRAGLQDGMLQGSVLGSTGSITTIEYERGVIEDLKDAITRLAPPDRKYAHDLAWGDGNGHSHVQAALLGPSICLPIRNGKLVRGTWQQVVVINHDLGPREREIFLTLIGTKAEQ